MKRKWSEEQLKKFSQYDAENTIQVKMKLNKKTDADIIEQLNKVNNKQGYIKGLIRADMKGE